MKTGLGCLWLMPSPPGALCLVRCLMLNAHSVSVLQGTGRRWLWRGDCRFGEGGGVGVEVPRASSHSGHPTHCSDPDRATLGGTRPPAWPQLDPQPRMGQQQPRNPLSPGGKGSWDLATTERFPETQEHSPEIPDVTQGEKAHRSIIWTSLRCLRLKTRELGTLGSREQRPCRGMNHRWFGGWQRLRRRGQELCVMIQRRQLDPVTGGCEDKSKRWRRRAVVKDF